MNLDQAIERARQYAAEKDEIAYIVRENEEWDWATEEDLEGFYLGTRPVYAITGDGECERL